MAMESGYDSCVIISDDEDEPSPAQFLTQFTCYYCRHLNFPSEEHVHFHIKEKHPQLFKEYSFKSRKCRICTGVCTSLTFMGLQSHVVERKCKPRLKMKVEERKKKDALFTSSSLVDVASKSVEPQRQENHVANQKTEKGQPQTVMQANYRNQESFILLQERIQNTQNSRPLGFNKKICGTRRGPESTDTKPKPKNMPHTINITQTVCNSFLCSSLDKNVADLCASCKENEMLLPDSRTHLPSVSTTDNPIPLNNPVALNEQNAKSLQIVSHRKAIRSPEVANKESATRANMKNSNKSMNLIKNAENPHVKLQNSKPPNNENTGSNQINPIVLKIKKELWEQVKMERNQSVEKNKSISANIRLIPSNFNS